MNIHHARAVHVWTANPEHVTSAQWPELASWLDAGELHCASRFANTADHQAYVLAHALRRLAMSEVLGVAPGALVFSSAPSGKPVLINAPAEPKIHFSNARRRSIVACAVSCIGPVGIDVEVMDASSADMGLLKPFMVLPDLQGCQAMSASEQARLFFFYWTVLEAFWKSRGSGLSFANPAITCQKNRTGWSDISLLQGSAWHACGRAVELESPAGSAASLVLDASCFGSLPGEVEIIQHTPRFFQVGGQSF